MILEVSLGSKRFEGVLRTLALTKTCVCVCDCDEVRSSCPPPRACNSGFSSITPSPSTLFMQPSRSFKSVSLCLCHIPQSNSLCCFVQWFHSSTPSYTNLLIKSFQILACPLSTLPFIFACVFLLSFFIFPLSL